MSNDPTGVPQPRLVMFMTEFSVGGLKKGPNGDPSVAMLCESGDLQVQIVLPADLARKVAKGIKAAGDEAEKPESGIVLPGKGVPESAEQMAEREKRLRGEGG